MNNKPNGFIICGTDTDVGKTIISSLFVQGLNASYWKPIQSGSEGGGEGARSAGKWAAGGREGARKVRER